MAESRSFRRTSSALMLWGGAAAALAGAGLTAAMWSPAANLGPRWVFPLAAGSVVVGGAVGVAGYGRSRRERLLDLLASRGFAPAAGSDAGALFGPLAGIWHLKTGAAGVRWAATGDVAGKPVLLCEHAYSVGSGKNRRTYVHTVAAVRVPAEWPRVELGPEGVLQRIGKRVLGARDMDLEDEAFNRRWVVKTLHPDVALALLPREVQVWLTAAPPQERWWIGSGVLCCMVPRPLRGEAVVALAERPGEWLRLLPDGVF